jgi:hypothetical protein
MSFDATNLATGGGGTTSAIQSGQGARLERFCGQTKGRT